MGSEVGKMRRRAIAFMRGKSVLGIARVHFQHQAVPRHLGEDTGGCDAEAQGIPAHEGGLWDGKRADLQPIDQHVVRRFGELRHGAPHGLMGRPQNIQPVNLLGLDHRASPVDLHTHGELFKKRLTLLWRQLFGIIEHLVPEIIRQHHRRRHDRPRQRTAPRFIDPRDPTQTTRAQSALMSEAASDRWHAPSGQNSPRLSRQDLRKSNFALFFPAPRRSERSRFTGSDFVRLVRPHPPSLRPQPQNQAATFFSRTAMALLPLR